MSPPPDLTGRWVGHYLQRGQEFPITATLVQSGERLSGAMRDGHPDRESSAFEAASEAGLPPGADEQIEQRLREAVPGARSGPVRFVSHLPAESVLEGRRRGQTVSVLKTYRGAAFGGWRVGDRLVGIKKEDHAVHYEGQLSPDGRVIQGRWWIDPDPEHGTPRTEGQFTLRRQDDEEVPPAGPAAASAEGQKEAGT